MEILIYIAIAPLQLFDYLNCSSDKNWCCKLKSKQIAEGQGYLELTLLYVSWHCKWKWRQTGKGEFSSSWSTILLFQYLFHPHITAVVRKRSQSLCQNCRWQVTDNRHTLYVCSFAWSDMVHGCMVYTERAETAAVSCGTSHASAVSTHLRWIFKNAL